MLDHSRSVRLKTNEGFEFAFFFLGALLAQTMKPRVCSPSALHGWLSQSPGLRESRFFGVTGSGGNTHHERPEIHRHGAGRNAHRRYYAFHGAPGRPDRAENLGAAEVAHRGARSTRDFWLLPGGADRSGVAGDAESVCEERKKMSFTCA